MHLAALAATLLFGAAAHAASLDGLPVEITNASEPVLCAEKDNVTLNLTNPQVRSFRIEAAHPAYIGSSPSTRQWSGRSSAIANRASGGHPIPS